MSQPPSIVSRSFPEDGKFRVAFSFAGERREVVRSIAGEVERQLGRGTVFFDDWFPGVLSGDRPNDLQRVYGDCDVGVPCYSPEYKATDWTRAENRAIKARENLARHYQGESARRFLFPVYIGRPPADSESICFRVGEDGDGARAAAFEIVKRFRRISAPRTKADAEMPEGLIHLCDRASQEDALVGFLRAAARDQ